MYFSHEWCYCYSRSLSLRWWQGRPGWHRSNPVDPLLPPPLPPDTSPSSQLHLSPIHQGSQPGPITPQPLGKPASVTQLSSYPFNVSGGIALRFPTVSSLIHWNRLAGVLSRGGVFLAPPFKCPPDMHIYLWLWPLRLTWGIQPHGQTAWESGGTLRIQRIHQYKFMFTT